MNILQNCCCRANGEEEQTHSYTAVINSRLVDRNAL